MTNSKNPMEIKIQKADICIKYNKRITSMVLLKPNLIDVFVTCQFFFLSLVFVFQRKYQQKVLKQRRIMFIRFAVSCMIK